MSIAEFQQTWSVIMSGQEYFKKIVHQFLNYTLVQSNSVFNSKIQIFAKMNENYQHRFEVDNDGIQINLDDDHPQQQQPYESFDSPDHGRQDSDESPFTQNISGIQGESSLLPDQLARIQQQIPQQVIDDFMISGGESLLSKMGGMLIARAYLPTPGHIKQALAYMDLAIKFELVLHELSNILFWLSVLEAGLFFLSIFLFFSNPVEMVYAWFQLKKLLYHIPHVFRAINGLYLYWKVPRSHQLAANISIPLDQKLTFDQVTHHLLVGAQDALTAFTSSTKNWLILYVFATALCVILDLVEFFTQVKHFGEHSAYADLALVCIASIFLIADFYYHLWVMTLSYKLPDFVGTSVAKIFFGLIEEVHQRLGNVIVKNKSSFQRIEQQERAKLTHVKGGLPLQQVKANEVNYPNPASARSSNA